MLVVCHSKIWEVVGRRRSSCQRGNLLPVNLVGERHKLTCSGQSMAMFKLWRACCIGRRPAGYVKLACKQMNALLPQAAACSTQHVGTIFQTTQQQPHPQVQACRCLGRSHIWQALSHLPWCGASSPVCGLAQAGLPAITTHCNCCRQPCSPACAQAQAALPSAAAGNSALSQPSELP